MCSHVLVASLAKCVFRQVRPVHFPPLTHPLPGQAALRSRPHPRHVRLQPRSALHTAASTCHDSMQARVVLSN
jgi:hypothetical protein